MIPGRFLQAFAQHGHGWRGNRPTVGPTGSPIWTENVVLLHLPFYEGYLECSIASKRISPFFMVQQREQKTVECHMINSALSRRVLGL